LLGEVEPWEILYLTSSVATTALIGWWAWSAVRRSTVGWTREARVAGAFIVALAASGALSFNYSRDRLGGMALVFYVLASYYAVRAVIDRVEPSSRAIRLAAGVALLLLTSAWEVRTIHTLEYERKRAANSHREWITDLRERREASAKQRVYLAIMEHLVSQGTAADIARPTPYPSWLLSIVGPF
jgi:hypothetical protein